MTCFITSRQKPKRQKRDTFKNWQHVYNSSTQVRNIRQTVHYKKETS